MKYEEYIEENANLKKALNQSKNILERTLNDFDTLKQLQEELKSQQKRVQKENDELSQRFAQVCGEKKELEHQFDTTIRNLKFAIEQKQIEIEEVQAKVLPSFDHDMFRIKIINELEGPHQVQLETKDQEIQKQSEIIYEYKRQLELLQQKQVQSFEEFNLEFKNLKQNHQQQVKELYEQIEEMSLQIEDNKNKEIIRNLKRQLQETEQKLQIKETESDEYSAELSKIKDEKNTYLIKQNKLLDVERLEKRGLRADLDKALIRSRCFEEESHRIKISIDNKNHEIQMIIQEKEDMSDQLLRKDDQIRVLQKRISDLEQELIEQQNGNQDQVTLVYNEEHNRFIQERNKTLQQQREIDNLKRENNDMMEKINTMESQSMRKMESQNQELKQKNDEFSKLKKQNNVFQRENEQLIKLCQNKDNQLEDAMNELDSVKNKFRDVMSRVQNKEFQIEPQPPTQQSSQEQSSRVEVLEKRNFKLQQKLKLANNKIMELMAEKVELAEQNRQQNYQRESFEMAPYILREQQSMHISKPNVGQVRTGGLALSPQDEFLINQIKQSVGGSYIVKPLQI